MRKSKTMKLAAAEQLVSAVKDFLDEVRKDDGDPWAERPTQDIFNNNHPIQEALTAWEKAK